MSQHAITHTPSPSKHLISPQCQDQSEWSNVSFLGFLGFMGKLILPASELFVMGMYVNARIDNHNLTVHSEHSGTFS